MRATRIDQPPVFDGLVNEPLWQQIEPATGFNQQQPDTGAPASEQTEVRIAFDDDNLYIGIICLDSEPGKIVVTQNRRDASLIDTDSVVILLDTFHDRQNAFLFGTSPTGIEYDGQVSKAGQSRGGVGTPARAGGQGGGGGAQQAGAAAFNLNWDGVWKVRSQITGRGWESEMIIPFKTLRYNPGDMSAWGFNVTRNLRRRNEQSYWTRVTRNFTINQVEAAGELEGLDLRTHRNLKLLPFVLGGFKQNRALADKQSKAVHDAGLDLKYSLTPSLTLDATLNTDFAQVEVDEEQVNLTRFDLFFPEKRPFFLENSGTFEFGSAREVEIFFSRRIGIDPSGTQVPIAGGVRLSGKAGKYDIGVLNMQTREVGAIVPANNFSVLRVSREFANRSSVGVIGVNRNSISRFDGARPWNRTFGTDLNLGFGKYANWFSYFAKSQTPGRGGSDHAGASSFAYDDQHHRLDFAYTEVGRNFNPEVGFVRRVGYRKPNFGYRYTHYPQGHRLRSIFPHFQWNRWYTLETNDKESGFEHYHLDSRWQDGSTLGLAWNRNFERLDKPFEVFPGILIPPGRYGYSEMVVNYGTDQTAKMFATGNASAGRFYGGTIRTINFNGGVRKGQNITWTGSYIRNFITLPEGAFTTDLIGLRFNWSFTPKSYLQAFTQYNSRSNLVGANIRLAVLSTSSTGFFLVYNTRVATVDYFDPHEVERRVLSQALFFKFNYLFDF
ncbi:MAG: carbohydrate binding family 9 domain-containing protein [Acidobacteriia bacterium]|nr:carbohydrate binding family 9 domain-containing protein [Terriglobia bacterium]